MKKNESYAEWMTRLKEAGKYTEWRQKKNAASRKYHATNKALIYNRLCLKKAANPDWWQKRTKEYAHKNQETLRIGRRQRYESRKEEEFVAMRKWIKRNPERRREISRICASKRRAQLLSNGGSHSWNEWVSLVRDWGNKCLCCWCPGNEHTLHRDHVISIASGGNDCITNIQPLCRLCNTRKSYRCIDYRFDRWAPMFNDGAK